MSSSSPPPTPLLAALLSPDAAGLSRACAYLHSGKCVAFPTETVYGLGANALDPSAVLSIFSIKGRPLTDPLIVHTASTASAEALLSLAPAQLAVFRALAAALWPGPLTLVAPASALVPPCVTAGTGYVGVRVPQHPTALALLRACGLPLAAPSANRFGHVSPTRAAHVLHDLGHADILVLDSPQPCAVGIESTVCRLEAGGAEGGGGGSSSSTTLTVLRRGGVALEALQGALAAAGPGLGSVALLGVQAAAVAASSREAQVAPGQLLTHYAPDLPTLLVSSSSSSSSGSGASGSCSLPALGSAIVLDFGGQLLGAQGRALGYRELVSAGQGAESAARAVFEALRWAEAVPGATGVLLADPRCVDASETAEAVRDRLFRAASGRAVTWKEVLEAQGGGAAAGQATE